MSLASTIRMIVKNYCDNLKLSDVVYGTIKSIDPISIQLDSYVDTFPSSFFSVPSHLLECERVVTISGVEQTIEFDSYLHEGDRVVLVKGLGGQKYIVVGKVDG